MPPGRLRLSSVAALPAGPGYKPRQDRVQTLSDRLHACGSYRKVICKVS